MFGIGKTVPSIKAEELRSLLQSSEPVLLLDVREPQENKLSAIDGSKLIPLGSLPENFSNLPKDRKMVVYCRSGARSADAVAFLQRQGFTNAVNLTGGMIAWSRLVKSN